MCSNCRPRTPGSGSSLLRRAGRRSSTRIVPGIRMSLSTSGLSVHSQVEPGASHPVVGVAGSAEAAPHWPSSGDVPAIPATRAPPHVDRRSPLPLHPQNRLQPCNHQPDLRLCRSRGWVVAPVDDHVVGERITDLVPATMTPTLLLVDDVALRDCRPQAAQRWDAVRPRTLAMAMLGAPAGAPL